MSEHIATWDGRDANGRAIGRGIFVGSVIPQKGKFLSVSVERDFHCSVVLRYRDLSDRRRLCGGHSSNRKMSHEFGGLGWQNNSMVNSCLNQSG